MTRKTWLVPMTMFALGVLLSEGVLRTLAGISSQARYYLSPPWARETVIDDPDLGYRMTSLYPGNDRWGFRNARVPDSTDILAIGDSMTYGFGAPIDKCWPRRLETLSGSSVYAMASGGYGPVEYHVLLDRGLALRPKTVVMEVYSGNDFSEAYHAVHNAGRGAEFRPQDPALEKELSEADARQPFANAYARPVPAEPPSGSNPIRQFLSRHSAIYGLIRGLVAAVVDRQGISMGEEADLYSPVASAPGQPVFTGDARFRTAFLEPTAYAMGMNLDDVRIREGQRITEAVLRSARDTLRNRGILFFVVVVPTKETVYAPMMNDQPNVPSAYFQLLKIEQRLINSLETSLAAEGIEFVDTTAALRASFGRGIRPYPPSDNTHPNANGYQAIAEAVSAALTAR